MANLRAKIDTTRYFKKLIRGHIKETKNFYPDLHYRMAEKSVELSPVLHDLKYMVSNWITGLLCLLEAISVFLITYEEYKKHLFWGRNFSN